MLLCLRHDGSKLAALAPLAALAGWGPTSARALAVALMRKGTAGLFRRWHSPQLTREALTSLLEVKESAPGDHARGCASRHT